MIKIMKYGVMPDEEIFGRSVRTADVASVVRDIIADVRKNGDEALFRYAEKFSVCLTAKKDEKADSTVRFHPSSSGNVFEVTKVVESLGKQAKMGDEGSVINVLGPYNKDAGGWVRINPVNGEDGDDRSVSAWRHALVVCDNNTP